MSFINVNIGLNLQNGVINSVIGNLNGVTKAAIGSSDALGKMQSKMSFLKNAQGLAGISNVISNSTAAVRSLVSGFEKVTGLVGTYAAQGDKIAKTSNLLGISVHDFQAFSSAAGLAGISTEELTSGLQRFTVNLGKARAGDASSKKIFDSILPKDLSSYKNSTDVITAIAGSYAKLGSAEQKAFVSQELFGKSGLKMSELLSGGEENLKSYIDTYHAGFDDKGAKSAEAFGDDLQMMNEQISGIKISVMQELFPAFSELFKTITAYMKKDGGKIKDQLVTLGKSVASFVTDLLPKIPAILDKIVTVVNFIGPGLTLFIGAFAAAIPFISQICIGIAGFLPVIKAIAAALAGPVVSGILLAVAAVIVWKKVIDDIIDNWDMLKSFIVDDVWGAVKDFFDKFIAVVSFAWDSFYSIFIEPFVNFFDAIPSAVSSLWDGFKSGISEIFGMIHKLWGLFTDGIKMVADSFLDLGGKIYDAIFGAVREAWKAAKGLLSDLPVIGNLFDGNEDSNNNGTSNASPVAGNPQYASEFGGIGATVGSINSSTTTTSRFAVDFQNMPRGVSVTPPDNGDFDYSRGYMFAGGV